MDAEYNEITYKAIRNYCCFVDNFELIHVLFKKKAEFVNLNKIEIIKMLNMNDIAKENIINYILTNNSKINRSVLESLKFESLVMIKVQIEVELAFKKVKKK